MLRLFHPFSGPEVTAVVMAISFHTSHRIYAVRSFFKGVEDVKDIQFPGAGKENDFNIRRILQSHGTCQVRCRIPSETAAKRDDDRFEIFCHHTPLD
jgi:hypothetical protein